MIHSVRDSEGVIVMLLPHAMISQLRFILALFCLVSSALAQVPGMEWERLAETEARAAGWSLEKLQAARDRAAKLKTEAVVIVTQGKILDAWGAVEAKFNVHSIRKSFLSALCGIQVQSGRLKLDATMAQLGINDNEPGLTKLEKTATVRQLLQARSGIYHPALYETASMKARRPARHSHAPGTFWYYNNWDFNVLGTIYEKECVTGIYEDFDRLIARRIGMQDYTTGDGSYVAGEDSIHRAYPFRMTARDMARFGLLFLRGGRWNGEEVIPASWVKESTTSWSAAGTPGGYGYLWWIERGGMHLPGVTLPPGSYSARGAGGHYILNVPALDLVIVHRVNTDIEGRRVESAEFGELVRLILTAYQPKVDGPLEVTMALLMSRHRIPGAAVLKLEQDRILSEHYLGACEAGKPGLVTAETLFEAASMTKPLVAYAALMLAHQGKLNLDLPLVSQLGRPYLEGELLHEKMTARMVLSHTSGFPNWRPKGGALRVMHEPGTAYLYSGEGFEFLQRVMEQVTGKDLESYLQNALLKPLDMKHSSLVWQEDRAHLASAGHDAQGRVKAGRHLYNKPNAAYSLYTTARDYAAFVQEMLKPSLLPPDAVQAMFKPVSPSTGRASLQRRGQSSVGDVRFGLGWSIEPAVSGPRVRHSGSNGTGFRSYVEFDPKAGHGLVILTNGSSGDGFWKDLVELIGVP